MLGNISRRQKILVMLAVMSGMLLAALDQTIVATALPRIVGDLHGLNDLSWVITAYLLTSTVSVPISGKLSDIYGRKKLFIFAIFVFVLGSALSGLSHNMAQLIGFRAFQGIGAGVLMSSAFSVIGDLFTPAERARWQGIIGAVFGLASVIGPLLGGYLTDHASWRWNFYINVPVGFIALIMISRFMPHIEPPKRKPKIDIAGASLLTIGLSTLLLGTVWGGNQFAWGSWQVLSMFTAALISLLAFVRVEAKHADDPVLPLDLFKNPIFRVSNLIMFLIGLAMFGAISYIPLFAQDVLGRTATNSGIILMPMVIGLVIVSIISGQIISRTGRYKALAVAGTAIVAAGILWLSTMNAGSTNAQLAERMVVMGVGLGISMPIFNLVVQNAFSHTRLGVVTSSIQLSRSIGATIGVALMGTILNNQLAHNLAGLGTKLNANQLSNVSGASLNPFIRNALSQSITRVFLIGGLITSLAFFASWLLREVPLRTSHAHEPELEKVAKRINAPGTFKR